jgi:hypothetical protein
MTTRTLMKRYPWYEKHFHAVNTVAACTSIDVPEILQRLDQHMRLARTALRPDATTRKAA